MHNLKGRAESKDSSDQDQASEQAIATSSTTDGVKGSVRFRELVEDHTVKGQAVSALNHIHSWSRIQDQIRGRRLCMVKEARIRQKKLEHQLKLEAKLHEIEVPLRRSLFNHSLSSKLLKLHNCLSCSLSLSFYC